MKNIDISTIIYTKFRIGRIIQFYNYTQHVFSTADSIIGIFLEYPYNINYNNSESNMESTIFYRINFELGYQSMYTD